MNLLIKRVGRLGVASAILLAASARAALDAYPNQLVFLDPVGTTSEPKYVELTNTGDATLTVVAVTPASGRFANAGGSCGTVPFTLAAQASCTLGYTSRPQAVGTIYQYLRATTADGSYEDFTLAGEGDLADLEVDPPTGQVRFMPPLPVGTISEEYFVTLHNSGRVRLQVLSIAPAVVPPVFAFVRTGGGCPEPPFTINAFFSCTVGYTFTPVAVGEAQLTVNFHNTAGSPESVTFSGLGLPEVPIFASGFEGS